MSTGSERAHDFIEFVANDPHLQKVLQNAVLSEIVAAGAAAGYKFTVKDLEGTPESADAKNSVWHK